MGITSRLAAVGATALLASTMSAAPANAAPARSAVEFCQLADESGVLEADGVTFGECINIFRGPASENSLNEIAGFCGFDSLLVITGTENKGQCIQVARNFVPPE